LTQFPDIKKNKLLIIEFGRGLYGVTTYFAVLHIGLLRHGTI